MTYAGWDRLSLLDIDPCDGEDWEKVADYIVELEDVVVAAQKLVNSSEAYYSDGEKQFRKPSFSLLLGALSKREKR